VSGTGLALARDEAHPTSDEALPIFGTFVLGAALVNRFRSAIGAIRVVVVEASTHRAWSASCWDSPYEPATMHVDEDDPYFERRTVGGWFNVDLYAIAPELPRTAKRVLAYAFVGELVSNVVDIRIGAGP